MSMKIKIKQCCHAPRSTVRFDAGSGDVVLLRHEDGTYYEATIKSITSGETLVVAFSLGVQEIEKEISTCEIKALMLGD